MEDISEGGRSVLDPAVVGDLRFLQLPDEDICPLQKSPREAQAVQQRWTRITFRSFLEALDQRVYQLSRGNEHLCIEIVALPGVFL